MKNPMGLERGQPATSGAAAGGASRGGATGYQPPTFAVISLDCEITSYAPDEDLPLF